MFIAKIQDNQVVNIVDCREVFGRVVPTDEQLQSKSYKRVNLFRSHDALTEKLVKVDPVIEGDWVYTVAVAQMTDDDIQAAKDSAMANIRAQRNQLLKNTDGTQAVDNPSPKKAEWALYRQELRDLPSKIVDPRTFNSWPKNPDWVDLTNKGELNA